MSNHEALKAQAQLASQFLKALANPDRLLLLCHLVDQERNVGELEQQLGITQPTLSQQLAVLRREGLVSTRRDGKQIYYRLANPAVQAVLETLHQHFCTGASHEP